MADNALKTLFTDCAEAIRETLPDIGKMSPYSFPDKIREVASAGGGGSGESSDLVKYVHFMSEDGTEEYYVKPTIEGDDCVNVVSKGLISKPTKESTNTQNFTYSGWSLEPNGSADTTNALKNVTEERYVYATFTSEVRYYTVNFYDSDGTTLLNTIEATYGANVSDYVPAKSGYTFGGWNPSVSNITGDTNTVAIWNEGISFAKSTWEDIIDAVNKGELDSFNVGDTRYESFPLLSSSSVSHKLIIVGIQHDDLADGSGKAGLSILASTGSKVGWTLFNTATDDWSISDYKNRIDTYCFEGLPDVLKSNIKEVQKEYYQNDCETKAISIDKGWLPSATELGLVNSNVLAEGNKYDYYETKYYTGSSNTYSDIKLGTNRDYYTRTRSKTSGNAWIVKANGYFLENSSTSETNYNVVTFGFCI